MSASSFHLLSDTVPTVEKILSECSKIEKMYVDLVKNLEKDSKKGIVVFSQFTKFLNLFRIVLNEKLGEKIQILMYTGEMSMKERLKNVELFNQKNKIPSVILVSIGAGACGISLQEGSETVMMTEPNYNPFMDKQAHERVHRMGQTKQVKVYSYIVNNSVEIWMDSLRNKKLSLASKCNLSSDVDHIPSIFTMEEIGNLFKHYVWDNPNKTKKNKTKKTKKNKTKKTKKKKTKKTKKNKNQ